MQTLSAKILDPTHLELAQPVAFRPGELIQIAVPDAGEEDAGWKREAVEKFLQSYDAEDAIYDEI